MLIPAVLLTISSLGLSEHLIFPADTHWLPWIYHLLLITQSVSGVWLVATLLVMVTEIVSHWAEPFKEGSTLRLAAQALQLIVAVLCLISVGFFFLSALGAFIVRTYDAVNPENLNLELQHRCFNTPRTALLVYGRPLRGIRRKRPLGLLHQRHHHDHA